MLVMHTISRHGAGDRPYVRRLVVEMGRVRRPFVTALRDWRSAGRRLSGRVDGVQWVFPLEEGWAVEVLDDSDPFRRPGGRLFFAIVDPGGLRECTEQEAVSWARSAT